MIIMPVDFNILEPRVHTESSPSEIPESLPSPSETPEASTHILPVTARSQQRLSGARLSKHLRFVRRSLTGAITDTNGSSESPEAEVSGQHPTPSS